MNNALTISRRAALVASLGTTASVALPLSAEAQRKRTTPARNVVLVHGLFADGSCWSDVIGKLQASALNVIAVQNPLTTLTKSADAVRRVLARTIGPTVLAGHSFAGTIITEVGSAPNVSALVYVAARAPDAGEDYAALGKRFPPRQRPPGLSSMATRAGLVRRHS